MTAATPGPGPKPTSPAGPSPSGPAGPSGPGRAADDRIFLVLDAILDDLKTPARRDLSPIGARTVATTGGPVSFSLPVPSGPPRFACDPYPPPFPGSPPTPPPPSPPRRAS